MKKLLSIIGILAVSGSAITSLAFTTNNSMTVKNDNTQISMDQEEGTLENNDELDWNEINLSLDEHFDDLYKKSQEEKTTKNFSQINEISDEEILNKAEEASKEYLENFKNQNANLDTVIETMSNEIPDFEENFKLELEALNQKQEEAIEEANEEETQNFASFSLETFANTNTITKKISSSDVRELEYTVSKNQEAINNLRNLSKASKIIAITAAVAAGGFWAAAWWFGITIPWAIAATAASVISGALAVKLDNNIYYLVNSNNALRATVNELKTALYSNGKKPDYEIGREIDRDWSKVVLKILWVALTSSTKIKVLIWSVKTLLAVSRTAVSTVSWVIRALIPFIAFLVVVGILIWNAYSIISSIVKFLEKYS